jgi:cytochrome c peroxidase
MHDGSMSSLREVIAYYNKLGTATHRTSMAASGRSF